MLEWERGRQLVNYGDFASFTYDAGGVRQSKTANGVTTSYFTEGNRIHKEERSDGKTLIYAYDESGIASITYNGTLYYVQKNFQGDIVALVNQSGQPLPLPRVLLRRGDGPVLFADALLRPAGGQVPQP